MDNHKSIFNICFFYWAVSRNSGSNLVIFHFLVELIRRPLPGQEAPWKWLAHLLKNTIRRRWICLVTVNDLPFSSIQLSWWSSGPCHAVRSQNRDSSTFDILTQYGVVIDAPDIAPAIQLAPIRSPIRVWTYSWKWREYTQLTWNKISFNEKCFFLIWSLYLNATRRL